MQDDFNPYAAPASTSMHPRAAEWLRSTDDPSLQKVAKGLGLIYVSLVLILASFILMFVLGLVFAAGPDVAAVAPQAAAGQVSVVVLLGGLGMIVAYLLNLVGSFMCLATPQETGAKGLITVSVVLMVLSLVLTVANYFNRDRSTEGLVNLLSVIGVICFIIFLRRLALFIGAFHLAQRARNILIALLVGVVLIILTVIFATSGAVNVARGGGGGMVAVALFVGLVLIVGGLVVLVMYANLINNLRKAIQSGGAVYS